MLNYFFERLIAVQIDAGVFFLLSNQTILNIQNLIQISLKIRLRLVDYKI